MADEYSPYFQLRRRRELEQESQIRQDLTSALKFQKELRVTGIIAPNIVIPRSFNSIEGLISKNFIRLCREEFGRVGDSRPLYATLAVSRDTLKNKQELFEFLDDITVMENPPDGFYVLVSMQSTEARSEIYNADVIAAWMFINHTLTLNGFQVINGFSDILAPFLGAAGGYAGATGWWSNLRNFSLNRFGEQPSGGRLPVPRYLSVNLLNRITFTELDQLRGILPEILNNSVTTDALYAADRGSEPQRNQEVLQAWDAIKILISRLALADQEISLDMCNQAIATARALYDRIPIQLDPKSSGDHLEALSEAVRLFTQLAETEPAAD